VHDDIAEHRRRRAVDISINVKIAANHHHRPGRRRPGRNSEIAGLDSRVVLDVGNSDALGVRILHGCCRYQQSQSEQDRFHYAALRLAMCAAVRMAAYPPNNPTARAR
jgi:hypothetical protein